MDLGRLGRRQEGVLKAAAVKPGHGAPVRAFQPPQITSEGVGMASMGVGNHHGALNRWARRTISTEENAMSQASGTNPYGTTDTLTTRPAPRRVSTETKAAVKTTELIAFVVVAVAMLIASQIVDGFDAQHAWFYLTLLTMGYMISRGLAKSGSRDFYDEDGDRTAR
jgi:hypothetical protein